MTFSDITASRLASQRVGEKGKVLDLVHHMGAIQAQDYYGALWAIGSRTGLTEAEVIETIEKREIVRTWPQRGTLHFVPAENAKWLVDLSAPRLLDHVKRRHENLDLNISKLNQSKEIFYKNLRGGKLLTRPEMLELLESAGFSTQAGRGYHMIWYAAQTGLIYIGPMKNKKQTFGLVDELQVEQRKLSQKEAITEHVKHYFTSHGPATLQDFMWWAGMKASEAKIGLEAAKNDLEQISIDGKDYWMAKNLKTKSTAGAFLLPAFDEYVVGYKNREAQMKLDYQKMVVPGSNGMFSPIVVIHGQVVGSWKRQIKKDKVLINVIAFKKLTAIEKAAIEPAAEAYGRFVGLKQELNLD